MSNFGLLDVGLYRPAASEIRTEFEDDLKAGFGDELAVGAAYEGSSVASILSGIICNFISAHSWEAAADFINNITPESASKYMLRNVKSMTATYAIEADYTYVTLRLGNSTGTDKDLEAGQRAQRSSDAGIFVTLTDVTIPAGGTVDVAARSELKGPYPAGSGTIDTIVDVQSGWDTVTNPADGTVGRDAETDAALRARVEKRGSTFPRIIQEVSAVDGVEYVSGIIVPIDGVETDGVKPGQIKLYVLGGDDEEVAQAIYNAKSAWATAIGDDVSVSITDSTRNQPETVSFNRITQVEVYLIVNVTVNTAAWTGPPGSPDTGDSATEIKTALAAYGAANLANGGTLKNWRLDGELRDITGLDTVTSIYQGLSASPSTTTDLTSTATQRLNIDAANIIVNSSAAS